MLHNPKIIPTGANSMMLIPPPLKMNNMNSNKNITEIRTEINEMFFIIFFKIKNFTFWAQRKFIFDVSQICPINFNKTCFFS